MSDRSIARCEHADGRMVVEGASAVVADAAGHVLAAFGDQLRRGPMRSTLKPLRTIALVRRRAIDEMDLQALALSSGSHTASSVHVAALNDFAFRYHVDLSELRCSIRAPLDGDATDERWERLVNECSGEHLGALVLAQNLGVPGSTYLDPHGAVQGWYSDTLSEALSEEKVVRRLDGRDGCGMPSFTASLTEIATAYARLASPTWFDGIGMYISEAIRSEALLYSGVRQFVHGLIEHSRGHVLGKGGADGLYAAWWPDLHLGAAARAGSGFHGAAAVALRLISQEAGLPFPENAPYYLDQNRVMTFDILA